VILVNYATGVSCFIFPHIGDWFFSISYIVFIGDLREYELKGAKAPVFPYEIFKSVGKQPRAVQLNISTELNGPCVFFLKGLYNTKFFQEVWIKMHNIHSYLILCYFHQEFSQMDFLILINYLIR